MNSSLASRLQKLEAELKVFSQSHVWVDMRHNRVRVDINHKRGEELTFDTVGACVGWLELQISQFENITGLALVDDVSQLLEAESLELFNEIYKDAPHKDVVINLVGRGKNSHDTLTQVVLASWWHSLSACKGWRQEVQARINALFSSLDGPAPVVQ